MPNYANGKIYKLWSLSTDDIYIGSTTQPLSKRIGEHRKNYKRYQTGKFNYITSFKILEYGDAKIELIEKVECKCKEELIAKEGHYIRMLDCVNKIIVDRTKEEWYRENRDRLLLKMKQYRETNKDKMAQQKKQWQEKNKELIAQRQKRKIKCECGSIVSRSGIYRHKKSKKHLAFMNTRN